MAYFDQLKARRLQILEVASHYGASNVRIFGSVARNEDTPESDIDMLVDLEPGRSLFDHIALKQDLEELLGKRVDLLTPASLHWYIRDRIMNEAQAL